MQIYFQIIFQFKCIAHCGIANQGKYTLAIFAIKIYEM